MFYSLFVFRISYKIIVLSSLNIAGRGPRAYPSLARGYGPETCGPGRAGPGRAGPGRAGPGLGQTFTVWVGPGRAWT